MNQEDVKALGWERLDFVLVTGDAYIDHPTFGAAVIGRVLLDAGFKVGILSQPDWRDKDAFKVFGRPRLGFLVTAGNLDSMVSHYTVSKRRREKDAYSPGGVMDCRPDRATLVYVNKIREVYARMPIIIGGIEASLRRFAHYDYWDDKVRRSILIDSEADLLVYGMGEHQIVEIAELMNQGFEPRYIRHIPGTCYVVEALDEVYGAKEIPSYEAVTADKQTYAKAFMMSYDEQDPIRGKTLMQAHGKRWVVQNPPSMPLDRSELDKVYSLDYKREIHPIYQSLGGVPGIEEVKQSIISERGCFGACSFCALTYHQGRIVQSRSHDSILAEAKRIVQDVDFKGYIHDVGGPTANFRSPSCKKQLEVGTCKHRQCLYPDLCENLDIDHEDLRTLLEKLRNIEGVKKVFLRSGLRYDYLMADPNPAFFKDLVKHHVSGQLKVAPEHVAKEVLDKMGKPAGKTYGKFVKRFFELSHQCGLEQYLVPYLMSSHPGSTLHSAIELALYLKDIGYQPEQVQDFYPTPGTLSTAMYYTELDPRDMTPVHVPKSREEKKMQRALLQYGRPQNYDIVYKALIQANRPDLIGFGERCLIKPKDGASDQQSDRGANNRSSHKISGARRGSSATKTSSAPKTNKAPKAGVSTKASTSSKVNRDSKTKSSPKSNTGQKRKSVNASGTSQSKRPSPSKK
ncbi:MAG: YgiQ family radical SAM protein [Erysipelotrichaceae bacterium]|nr:YgiQ family radical SAM protein [Erysipelotrichaceae bacterium]